MNRSLSISEWHHLACEGTAPPVRIRLNGWSMFPLIRCNKDYVTVISTDEEMIAGTIVLFCQPDNERYIVHRIWDIKENLALTWGDNCLRPDGWIPLENIWGKVVLIERGKKTIHPVPAKGMKWARIWHQIGKVYRLYQRYKYGILRRVKKLIKR